VQKTEIWVLHGLQIKELETILHNYYRTIKPKETPNVVEMVNYVFAVWIPEVGQLTTNTPE